MSPPDLPRSDAAHPLASLNDAQKRSVLFSFLDLHRRMVEMESLLAQGPGSSPFAQYINDLSPTEAKVVRDYFDRLRARMLACLEEAGIAVDVQRTSVRWGLQVGMTFL